MSLPARVIGLTKEMALELAKNNIQVNAVAPGVTETPMTQNFFLTESGPAVLRKLHPAGRWAQPEEIARMILFLASAEADFVTGATFSIDGGFVAGRSLRADVSRVLEASEGLGETCCDQNSATVLRP